MKRPILAFASWFAVLTLMWVAIGFLPKPGLLVMFPFGIAITACSGWRLLCNLVDGPAPERGDVDRGGNGFRGVTVAPAPSFDGVLCDDEDPGGDVHSVAARVIAASQPAQESRPCPKHERPDPDCPKCRSEDGIDIIPFRKKP